VRFAEYKIVVASTPEKLVAEVNKLMKDRWQPCGGIVVTREVVTGIQQLFMQAMVREPRRHLGRQNRASEQVQQSVKHQTET
jgi:hypothetical protein